MGDNIFSSKIALGEKGMYTFSYRCSGYTDPHGPEYGVCP